jgi:hypothetical protein
LNILLIVSVMLTIGHCDERRFQFKRMNYNSRVAWLGVVISLLVIALSWKSSNISDEYYNFMIG